MEPDAPTLSVIVPTREPISALTGVLEALVGQTLAVGGEVIVVGGTEMDVEASPGLRLVPTQERDIMRLRSCGFAAARGDIVAIGEDHAFARPEWAESIVRAHAEHPDTPIVVGCLVNSSDHTSPARGHFLSFASPFLPPMTTLPTRPPPTSTVSIKRDALDAVRDRPGAFETELLPRLHIEGEMVVDDRIVVEHHQPFTISKALSNALRVARTSYGYGQRGWTRTEQRWRAKRALQTILLSSVREARVGRARLQWPRRDLLVVGLIGMALTLGAVVGSLRGPGRAPLRCS